MPSSTQVYLIEISEHWLGIMLRIWPRSLCFRSLEIHLTESVKPSSKHLLWNNVSRFSSCMDIWIFLSATITLILQLDSLHTILVHFFHGYIYISIILRKYEIMWIIYLALLYNSLLLLLLLLALLVLTCFPNLSSWKDLLKQGIKANRHPLRTLVNNQDCN